jgi:long-chain acyl-CoA synthetase
MGSAQAKPLGAKCVPIKYDDDGSPIYVSSHRIEEPTCIDTYPSFPEADDLVKIVESCANKYENKKSMGERKINPNGSYGNFQWLSYRQLYNKVLAFAAALQKKNIQKGDLVGIFSQNCLFWHIAEFAIHLCGAVVVPISDRLGPDSSIDILKCSEVKAVVVHSKEVQNFKKASDIDVSFVIVICFEADNFPDNYMKMDDFVAYGRKHISDFRKPEISPLDPAYVIYTSSENGLRGCVLTHRSVISAVTSISYIGASITTKDSFISYIPLAHVYAISVEWLHFVQGAAIGFYTGDLHNLSDDIKTLRPTVFCGVPRIFNRILDEFNERLAKYSSFHRHIYNLALSFTSELLKQDRTSYIIDRFVLGGVRKSLGGRVRLIVIGGAPVRGDVYEFLTRAVTPNVVIGYGITESSAAGSIQEVRVGSASSVGAVSVGVDIKLRKVEGLCYDPIGSPPTGEVLLRGPSMFSSYFKKEKYDGTWFPTGDIGMITGGRLQIIDQVKPLIKLSQGEYLSAQQLANKYRHAKGIESIVLVADPHHSRPVAIVVPSTEFIEEWKRNGITDIASSETAALQIVQSLDQYADKERLRSFERVCGVIIETDAKSIDQSMHTSSIIRSKYASRVLDLYSKKGHSA